MRLSELFRQGKFVITCEVGPPKGIELGKVIDQLERQIDREALTPNSDRINKIKSQLRSKKDERAKIVKEIESKFPHLVPFIGVSAISVHEVRQRIGAETALVEYLVARDKLVIWIVTGSEISGTLSRTH